MVTIISGNWYGRRDSDRGEDLIENFVVKVFHLMLEGC